MPSRDRFLLSFEPAADYLRRNPLTVIGGGAILCGAAVAAVILTAAPHQPVIAAGSVPPANAVAKKVEPARPGLETMGQATPVQNADARGAECESQTWPYISRSCLTRDDTERRKVRVIATDQLSKPLVAAIEAPPAESDKSVRATVVTPKRDVAAPGLPGSAPVVRQEAQEETATAAVAMPLPLPRPAAPTAANNMASDPVQPALPVANADPVAPQPVAAVATTEPASGPATEAVRQPVAERRISAAERRAERRAERERARQARAEQRNARRGVHVVERWTERTYVAEDRFGASRRVVVIQRHGAPERGFEAYASSSW